MQPGVRSPGHPGSPLGGATAATRVLRTTGMQLAAAISTLRSEPSVLTAAVQSRSVPEQPRPGSADRVSRGCRSARSTGRDAGRHRQHRPSTHWRPQLASATTPERDEASSARPKPREVGVGSSGAGSTAVGLRAAAPWRHASALSDRWHYGARRSTVGSDDGRWPDYGGGMRSVNRCACARGGGRRRARIRDVRRGPGHFGSRRTVARLYRRAPTRGSPAHSRAPAAQYLRLAAWRLWTRA
jgi:hypothetical protein